MREVIRLLDVSPGVGELGTAVRDSEPPEQLVISAARLGDITTLKTCIRNYINLNVEDQNGNNALHIVIQLMHSEAFDLLLSARIDKNAMTNFCRTPLHWAVIVGDERFVTALLASGARVDLRDLDGMTPADYAHIMKNPDILDRLRNLRACHRGR